MRQLRWTFHVGNWRPTLQEWEMGLSSIQPEEVVRIQKFQHQSDVKCTLVGRLLLRRAGCALLQVPWKEVTLERTVRGKPYVVTQKNGSESPSMNVSHRGNYTALAASDTCQLGVDVMQTKWPPKQDGDQYVNRFFHLMRRKFTDSEWRNIKRGGDFKDKLFRFHRHWCLKECYIKAIGIGVHFDLKRIEFDVKTNIACGYITNDTKLVLDGKLQENWHFEETMLDSTHCVSTALCSRGEESGFETEFSKLKFKELTFSELTESAHPLGHGLPSQSYERFLSLKEKPGRYNS